MSNISWYMYKLLFHSLIRQLCIEILVRDWFSFVCYWAWNGAESRKLRNIEAIFELLEASVRCFKIITKNVHFFVCNALWRRRPDIVRLRSRHSICWLSYFSGVSYHKTSSFRLILLFYVYHILNLRLFDTDLFLRISFQAHFTHMNTSKILLKENFWEWDEKCTRLTSLCSRSNCSHWKGVNFKTTLFKKRTIYNVFNYNRMSCLQIRHESIY